MVNSALIFISSIAGIFAYFMQGSKLLFIALGLLFLIGIATTVAAHVMTKHHPITATRMFVAWRIVPLTFVFLGAFGSVWMSLNLLEHLPFNFSTKPELAETVKAQKATLQSLTTTAITTLLAAIVLDAARDPTSGFWPAERHKTALVAAFHESPIFGLDPKTMKTEVKHAIQDLGAAYIEPRTADNIAKGWTYKDRLHRARVIRAALDTLAAQNIKV